ncbi:glycosyl transferase [Brachionus plicatilis]|uniref:UDP-glucuronosyltransferase n=1 Tax=Brachionus plicatilis TaxID=10195 RepID=A0A3M7QQJ0_BRAPC|nr:glycosyl transferase [Brachionus plicatilis]
MANQQKTIFICALPGTGHLNPILRVSAELVGRKHRVIVFCDDMFQKIIEKSGAEYRPYSVKFTLPSQINHQDVDDTHGMLLFFFRSVQVAYEDVGYMLEQVNTERPDLIIYDQFSFTTKYLFKLMEKNYQDKASHLRPPKSICFYTCFAMRPSIYPDHCHSKRLLVTDYWSNSLSYSVFNEQVKLCHKYKIEAENPFELAYNYTTNINIISCFPELQPESEKFDSSFKFVGCCLSNESQNFETSDKQLGDILQSFEPINPNYQMSKFSKQLVYASLGTLFNHKVCVFEKIIESVKILNNSSVEIMVLISCGKTSLEYLAEKVKNGYNIPDNVALFEFVPQIEILKRASLFITHAGMNSSSEAVHYGVPVICIPIKADQPLCAIRLADDLKLGVRLDADKFGGQELFEAIKLVLTDSSFRQRAVDFSKISRKYDGTLKTADIVQSVLSNEFY